MTRQQTHHQTGNINTSADQPSRSAPPGRLHALPSVPDAVPASCPGAPPDTCAERRPESGNKTGTGISRRPAASSRHDWLREARLICQVAAAKGECISQRALARQLRDSGHRFSNDHLHGIAATIGLTPEQAA
jgi:hypothetical protein